jgi:hypothetical protein
MPDVSNLRVMVRGAYDVQKLRVQVGNRIVANFKAKLGQKPSESEETLDEKGKAIIEDLRARYKKITDGVKTFPRQAKFKGDEVISSYTELCLLAQYIELEEDEKKHFRRFDSILKEYPIFTQYLEDVKGVGPALAGVIISEIDIHKSRYASSLAKYAGLDVAEDGKGRSRKAEHLIKVKYKTRDGEEAERNSITFNPFLKTKLVGVLGPSFLKAKNEKYSKAYYDYKHRLECHPEHQAKTKAHRHNMAIRYTVKLFLYDLYAKWRALEGLDVHPPYHEAKLGLHHRE